ncbi:MAG TPA: GGDEF domain-containing protein, partial [Solirubrobacteraceae bacterium]
TGGNPGGGTGGGSGDGHGGPPLTGGGPGGGTGGGHDVPPLNGTGTGGNSGGGAGDGHGAPPPNVVAPPPLQGGGTGGDTGGGGVIGGGGDGGGGDGHDRGKHHSGHPSVCSGICHTSNDHLPSSSTPVPVSPVTPVTRVTSKGTNQGPTQKPTFSFSPGAPALVTVTHPGSNPAANGANLGSSAPTGVTAQAAGGGLGQLAPATSNIAVHGGSGSASGGGQGSAGHATSQFGGPGGIHVLDSSGIGPGAVLTFVRYVPTVVWIALGACILLAACMSAVAFLKGRHASREVAQRQRVEAVAKTDPLTGVLNRRGFTEAVDRELARARRHGRQFVLAYVDVRGLKAVNDTEGHLAGDELLKTVATLLTESARADDVVGRIGGDELGLLLVEQSGDSAAAVTRRIEAQVSARRSELGLRTPWGLTVGTSAFPEDGDSFDDLVAAADRRLYQQRGIALADGRALVS